METIVGIGEIALGLLFAVAAIAKIHTWRDKGTTVIYELLLPMLTARSVHLVRGVILAAELCLAFGLVVGPHRSFALAFALVLLFGFTCVLVFVLATHGFDTECACFGSGSRSSGIGFAIYRNVFLIVIAAVLLILETHGVAGTPVTETTMWDIGGVVLVCLLVAVLHRFASRTFDRSIRPENQDAANVRLWSRE